MCSRPVPISVQSDGLSDHAATSPKPPKARATRKRLSPDRNDIGPLCTAERARLCARIDELSRELRHRDLVIAGLERRLADSSPGDSEIPAFLGARQNRGR
jgi:hypothetical protein